MKSLRTLRGADTWVKAYRASTIPLTHSAGDNPPAFSGDSGQSSASVAASRSAPA
jgi:hypothetical protein